MAESRTLSRKNTSDRVNVLGARTSNEENNTGTRDIFLPNQVIISYFIFATF